MKLEGEGNYDFEIVGESRYQAELASIAGPKDSEGKWFECEADIRPEPENPYDRNALAVYIWQKKVGYFSRDDAEAWSAAMYRNGIHGFTCDAVITGGWKNNRDEGHYGVRLDLSDD